MKNEKELSMMGEQTRQAPGFYMKYAYVINEKGIFQDLGDNFTIHLHRVVKISNNYSQPKNERNWSSINDARHF